VGTLGFCIVTWHGAALSIIAGLFLLLLSACVAPAPAAETQCESSGVSLIDAFCEAANAPDPEPPEVDTSDGYCSVSFLDDSWGSRAAKAARVCYCESTGNPRARSGDFNGDGVADYIGLFQVDWKLHGLSVRAAEDPYFNSQWAADHQAENGWGPWPNCGKL
jgi:hypothetical protein